MTDSEASLGLLLGTHAELVGDGLLEFSGERVRLTALGRLMSNDVFERFLSNDRVSESALVLVD